MKIKKTANYTNFKTKNQQPYIPAELMSDSIDPMSFSFHLTLFWKLYHTVPTNIQHTVMFNILVLHTGNH